MLNNFSVNVIGRISGFIDNTSILRLREEKVSAIISTRNSTINRIQFYSTRGESNEEELNLSIHSAQCFLWKLAFIHFVNKNDLDVDDSLKFNDNMVSIHLCYDEMASFLDYLNPRMQNARVEMFQTPTIQSTFITKFAIILEGKTINSLELIEMKSYHFDRWINFFSKVSIGHAKFTVQSSVEFLLNLAEKVKSVDLKVDRILPSEIFSLFGGMLNRKCEEIAFQSDHKLNLCEIERLLRVISRIDKKVWIRVNVDDKDQINSQVGMYKVETFLFNKHVSIKHLDFVGCE